jgi:cellulose synthase/poly-beta-1,6-N-acetylglucosamine synthase-like glycosyltransferase
MNSAVSWTCPACSRTIDSRYCATCGEEPQSPRDLTLRGLAEKIVQALTSVDAKVVRTTWKLLRGPGELTLSWTRGLRKPYVAPFQLFLLANVIFFALQSLTGETVFSSTLDSHLHHQDWSELAQSIVAEKIQAKHVSLDQFALVFDQAVLVNAKSLIFLMAMAFALVLPLAFLGERRPFMLHVVFSLHLYTFLLLLFCLAILVAKSSALVGFGGLETARVDNVISVINLGVCALYIYFAIGPTYRTSGFTRVAKAFLLAIAVALIVLGYRFMLFLITIYSS